MMCIIIIIIIISSSSSSSSTLLLQQLYQAITLSATKRTLLLHPAPGLKLQHGEEGQLQHPHQQPKQLPSPSRMLPSRMPVTTAVAAAVPL
jgi:hypothetical protein